MVKKTGIGSTPLAWVQDTTQTAPEEGASPVARPHPEKQAEADGRSPKEQSSEVPKLRTSKVPKFETFEVKLSVLLRSDQLEFLEKLAREIMKNRDKTHRQERITKNTLVRAGVDMLKELAFEKGNISNEEELRRRIRQKAAALKS